MTAPVTIRRESVVLPTYRPAAPDRNPMFLESRVYQGSSGRVYPLPFYDRIAEQPVPQAWDVLYLENEFLLVMILPELGGRIHRLVDKTNGADVIYYQPVIKPALVGLAGPWISGGIEFNWPQHHRPSTFMPADVHIEPGADGSVTVWLGEHDPMARMKGMHGVCLHPGRAVLEVKARVYNRTADVQTFLWWANVATRVHEQYQSFFPPDATYVADHAKRAMSTFPRCSGHYYGIDYAQRGRTGIPRSEIPRQYVPPHCGPDLSTLNYSPADLSWYANIPVPTSYMCMGTDEDFFGGYDHRTQAGIVHVADHHIAPGKKQWTWGNHEFGYAWDRNLTDADEHGEYRPYIELMAGVFTDNQPDFSFLQPGETKAWSQHWYPIRAIGPAHHANLDAAVSLNVRNTNIRFGVAVTAAHCAAVVTLSSRGRIIKTFTRDLAPAAPLVEAVPLRQAKALALTVKTADGRVLLRYTPRKITPGKVPAAATEPPAPADIASADELYLTGLHLEQYRHATRGPELYWREALRRDAGDARCNLALGRWHLRRGEFDAAEKFLRASLARLTHRNPNPADGEAHYQLGVCLRHQADALVGRVLRPTVGDKPRPTSEELFSSAYDAFFKATWNQAWQSAGFLALAEIDCTRHDWSKALDHLDRSLRLNTDQLRARSLRALVLRQLGRETEATAQLQATLALDPLDWSAHHLVGSPLAGGPSPARRPAPALQCDNQVRLDLALDYTRAGFHEEALDILASALSEPHSGTGPLVHYYRARACHLIGDMRSERRHLAAAAKAAPDYCFPARLEEIAILQHAIAANPRDARAPFYLGNLLYDRRRHREAIALWQRAVQLEPANAVAWRNLGIGCCNVLAQPAQARRAYDAACRASPRDARLLFERDQLWKRLGEKPLKRLRELEKYPALVATRDDLSVEFCALCNQTGRPEQAAAILARRKFQPWEGGEGQALGQHTRTHLLLGRAALAAGDAARAVGLFTTALAAPENLGEAKHLLANQSDGHFWLGEALAACGETGLARQHWAAAAHFTGDFQGMSVRAFSEMTYYSALAWQRLGRKPRAARLLRDLLAHARQLGRTQAKVDYFATSLPTMLLFTDDLAARQQTSALFLEAQARLGLGQAARARRLLSTVLRRDPNHAAARDLTAVAEPSPKHHPSFGGEQRRPTRSSGHKMTRKHPGLPG
jgi:tetratricopeptide (TPR) repeat protein